MTIHIQMLQDIAGERDDGRHTCGCSDARPC